MDTMTKIGLSDIPSGNVYVKLKQGFVESNKNWLERSNTVLPKEIKDQLYRLSLGKKCSLKFVKEYSLNMDVSMSEFQSNIELLTSAKFTDVGISTPRFPIDFATEEGMRLIGAILGDGELTTNLHVRYNNQDEYLVQLVARDAEKLFGKISSKLYLRNDHTYQLHYPKIVGIIVSILGIEAGKKTNSVDGIPDFVFGIAKRKKSVLIRQFFNDEGNVRLKDRRIQVKQTNTVFAPKDELIANPDKYAHPVLVDMKKLLFEFGIDSRITLGACRQNKADWELSFYRIENLKRFQKEIGFDSVFKRELLEKAIKSYKIPSAARNGRLDYAKVCYERVKKKHGHVTKELLAKEAKRSVKTATYYLIDLKKKGFVKKCV